jgi:hypothetical protein
MADDVRALERDPMQLGLEARCMKLLLNNGCYGLFDRKRGQRGFRGKRVGTFGLD